MSEASGLALKVWREGFAPFLSQEALVALRGGVASHDPRLIQGATTVPPPLQCVQDWPVEAACAVGYCFWQGDGLATVGEVEEAFARLCFECDQRMGEPAVCRHWLNWYDETPWNEMAAIFIIELDREIARRRRGEELNAASLVEVTDEAPHQQDVSCSCRACRAASN